MTPLEKDFKDSILKIDEVLARKVLQTVDCGLSSGLGSPEPGKMCIEAAVNYAMGLPHGDNPSCVGLAVRRFKIELNDASWSSNEARGKGLRKIAIAQLGSDTLNQIEFAERMAIRNCQVVLPALFYKLKLDEAAKRCAEVNDISSTIEAAKSAESAAESAKYAAESAAESAKYAAESAESAAESAAKSAEYAAESAAESAKSAAKSAAEYDPDFFFKLSAQVCLDVLIEMKSPGCEFLFLTD